MKIKPKNDNVTDIYCPHCGKLLLSYNSAINTKSTNLIIVEKSCKCGTKVYYKKEMEPDMIFV